LRNESDLEEARYEYNLKINEKEQELAAIGQEQQALFWRLEDFSERGRQSFNALEVMEDKMNGYAVEPISFSETEHKKRYMLQLRERRVEEMRDLYEKKKQDLADQLEELQRERDALAWD